MKKNKIYILLLCAALTIPAFGQTSFKERSDNWLKSSQETGDNGLPDVDDDGGSPTSDPDAPGPIGDANWVILALGLTYGVYILGRKRKSTVTGPGN
jgi:hypothetical protein